MKLIPLLPVGKIESRKPLKEILDIHTSKDGVSIAVDDYDDILFRGRSAGLHPEELKPIIEALAKTRWFIKLVVNAAKRKVRIIELEFTNAGIMFR